MPNGEDPRLNRVKEILVLTLERRMPVSAGCKLANYYLYLAKPVGEEAIWKEETKERKMNSMRVPALGRSEESGRMVPECLPSNDGRSN
jgi:hypothetical protein